MELAKAGNLPVLFTPAELPSETADSITSAQLPLVSDLKRAQIMAMRPTGEEVQLAEVVEAPPAELEAPVAVAAAEPAAAASEAQAPSATPAAPSANTASADTLPATAGSMPIFVLLGLLALGGAAALWAVERHLS